MAEYKVGFFDSGWPAKRATLLVVLSFFTGVAHAADAQIPPGAEKFVPPGMYVEHMQQGDLSGKGQNDLVLVLGDRKNNIDSSSTILVLMRKSDGSLEQVGSNDALLVLEGRDWGMQGGWKISINKGVLIVDLLVGSRDGAQGVWRFRFDPKQRRMRLIGFDLDTFDKLEGGTRESTNYLTGKRITETWAWSQSWTQGTDLGQAKVTSSRTTSVATPKIYLEQVTPERLR